MDRVRWALRLNVFTCAVFGVVFLLFAPGVGAYLGAFPPLLLKIIGAALLFQSAHLLLGSLRKEILPGEVYYFSAGDILWFLGSLLLLVSTGLVTTPHGAIATIVVAVLVAGIGLAQLWFLSEAVERIRSHSSSSDHIPQHFPRLEAIGFSWMQIKTWVKVWLFVLNGVFLAAFFYWPTEFSQVTLAAYFATAPILIALMIVQRGLTRLLGIAHLIPWMPLLAYVGLRISGDCAGRQITYQHNAGLFSYAIVLFAFVAVCLAFDVYDFARWVRGDSARIGSQKDLASRQRHEETVNDARGARRVG